MILYTKPDCPLCAVVRTKLKLANIPYTECQNEQEIDELKIEYFPSAKIENKEEILGFKEILNYIREEK